MMHVMPMNRFATIMAMYAADGSSNRKDAGYIIGVIDQLQEGVKHVT